MIGYYFYDNQLQFPVFIQKSNNINGKLNMEIENLSDGEQTVKSVRWVGQIIIDKDDEYV
ncbi:hypothetical protein [Enterococcus mundtii]|uniref:hypothetical protein n=1 Tax=Enterococcus mundtii TaxID=53346 RepID=UPI000A336309|nr:hypothetical protein [Enterococcus mundtii]